MVLRKGTLGDMEGIRDTSLGDSMMLKKSTTERKLRILQKAKDNPESRPSQWRNDTILTLEGAFESGNLVSHPRTALAAPSLNYWSRKGNMVQNQKIGCKQTYSLKRKEPESQRISHHKYQKCSQRFLGARARVRAHTYIPHIFSQLIIF